MYSAVQWVNIRHMRAHPARTADGMTTFLRRPRSSKTIWFQLPLSMHLGLFAFFLCVLTNEWSWSSDAGNGSHSNVDINLVVSDREISHIHNSDALYLLPAIIIINAAARQRYFFCEPLMLLAAYCWNPLNGISDSSTWRDACKLIWSRYERVKNKKKK